MATTELLIQTFVAAIVSGIIAQVIAEKVKLPSIVFLMLFGFLLGPQVFHVIEPSVLGDGLEVFVSLAVALILFEGGLSLDLNSFKQVNQSVRNMVTAGMLLMIGGSAFVLHLVMDLDWLMCVLYGAFMSITGLTVINPILQRVRIKKDLVTILRSEGILTNAIGAFVAVTILEVILATESSLSFFALELAKKFVVGSLIGFAMGWFLGRILKRKFISSDLKNLATLAWVFATYYISSQFVDNTGILAVVMAGYAVQRENIPQISTLKKFKGQLSILMISILFILISANLDINNLLSIGKPGVLVVLAVILLVRPIAIFVSNSKQLSVKEMLFVSWIGPKGIVSASVASLFALILVKHGHQEAVLLESLVYATIIVTVLAQGLSAAWVARLCDCLAKTGGVLIVGANTLGRTLGTAFAEIGRDVTLIDNNFDHCKASSEDGLETVYGNCLDPVILELAGIDATETMIATTSNSEVNFLISQLAKDSYSVPKVYPAIDSPDKGVHHKLVEEIGGNLAYAKTVSIEDWKLAIDQSQVQIVEWEINCNKTMMLCDLVLEDVADEDYLPLILKRDSHYYFAHSDQLCSKGDVLIYLYKGS